MSDAPEDSKLPPIPEEVAEASRAEGREYTIIGGDGAEYGPRTQEEVADWIATGRADHTTLARTGPEMDWQPLGQFPELAACLRGAGPVPQRVPRPGKFQAVAMMTLLGGILSLGWTVVVAWTGLSTLLFVCCFIPSGLYSFIAGILITVQGARLLGDRPGPYLPRTASAATLMIVCILALNPFCLVLGIVNHWLLNDAMVREYVEANSRP